jgi:tether containing UBX domain for GLUT4
MSTHVEVMTSEARRARVKVNPGTHLIDILNEGCGKLGLNSDRYLLK